MNLISIGTDECLDIATKIATGDGLDEQSTWIYDRPMQKNCDCYRIQRDGSPFGFMVLQNAVAGLFPMWLSLYRDKRSWTNAQRALSVTCDKVFNELGGAMMQSEVFIRNVRSIKIHSLIMRYVHTNRSINEQLVSLYEMSRRRHADLKAAPYKTMRGAQA